MTTTIVLIILDGVAIYLTLGNNGILNKAEQAKNETITVSSLEKYNKFYIITINTGYILATNNVPAIVFKRGTLNYSAYTNDVVYVGFATYLSDTSVKMSCSNVTKVELYGEY